ncbi:MAG: hypothetical protein NVS1B4_12290 [Gemmatimonadaceae bacterium]
MNLDDKLGTIYGPPHVQGMEEFDQPLRERLHGIMQGLGATHIRTPTASGAVG